MSSKEYDGLSNAEIRIIIEMQTLGAKLDSLQASIDRNSDAIMNYVVNGGKNGRE